MNGFHSLPQIVAPLPTSHESKFVLVSFHINGKKQILEKLLSTARLDLRFSLDDNGTLVEET